MKRAHELPDLPGLRKFGLMFGTVIALLFGLLIPFFRHGLELGIPFTTELWPTWPWIAGLVIIAWAAVHPASLPWLYRPWMRFAQAAQWFNTRLILLLLFYVIILPIGLIMRLLGKDPMQRRFDAGAGSYRVASEQRGSDHMEKPY